MAPVRRAPLLLAALALATVRPGRAAALLGRRARHRGDSSGSDVAEAPQSTSSLAVVIELLSTMLKDFNQQDKDDRENWETYSKWSDQAEQERNTFVQKQKALVMSLTSKMSANKQLVQKLTEDMESLEQDIRETKSSIKDLLTMRSEEHATFETSEAEVTKTISAVTKATEILEGHYAAGGAALAEIRKRVRLALTMFSVRRSSKDLATLSALLQDGRPPPSLLQGGRRGPDWLSSDGSKYNDYEKQAGSAGVLGMLDDLKSQLESQKQELVSNEADSQRQFDETRTAKNADLKGSMNQQTEKTEKKTRALAVIATCRTGIDEATAAITEGKKYLVELLADRVRFQQQKDTRASTRSQEQAATQAALDALQAVSAGATATVEGGASLLQVSSVRVENAYAGESEARALTARKQRVEGVLRKLLPVGRELKSAALLQMVGKLLQDYDPGSFGPVIKLLDDLVTRLESEQSAETTQHEWCETEKDQSVKARTEREGEIKRLKATIESLTTQVAQLKSEIEFLTSEMERVEVETKTAKQIRKNEHDVFGTAKADHEEVIGAIRTALGALGGQYGLLQLHSAGLGKARARGGRDSPFDGYASGADSAGSATEMLEDLQSRYSAALENLIQNEHDAEKAYEELLATNKLFFEMTKAEKQGKTKERREALQELADDKADMKTNLLELHEVAQYLQDLRPSCDDIRSTYEERKKRREAEIAALKEALEVIQDPSGMDF